MDLGTPNSDRGIGRRQVLAGAGTVTFGGLAGCIDASSGGLDTLNVAFKPVFPFLQFPVMRQRGMLKEMDASVEATNFANKGLTIVSAYADGDVDVAFMGITPAIKMRSKGVPGRVVAANHRNGFAVMAHEEFATLYEDHGADAFAKFREQKGRKFKFATFPKASVAYILVHLWLEELGVSTDEVALEPMGGGGSVKRALLSGKADGTFIMEPIRTVLEVKDAPYRQIAWSGEFMSGQPGGVTFVHDRVWKDNPSVGKALLERHVKATDMIENEPKKAATAVSEAMDGKVPKKIARKAIKSKASNYVTDPKTVMGDTQPFVSRMHEMGQIPKKVKNDALFERSLYADVA